jgi:hypothetical protein
MDCFWRLCRHRNDSMFYEKALNFTQTNLHIFRTSSSQLLHNGLI